LLASPFLTTALLALYEILDKAAIPLQQFDIEPSGVCGEA